MSFDQKLAGRIRTHLGKKKGIVEKKMFGGIAFLLNGNMSCGVHGSEMIVRSQSGSLNRRVARLYVAKRRPNPIVSTSGESGLQ